MRLDKDGRGRQSIQEAEIMIGTFTAIILSLCMSIFDQILAAYFVT